MILHEDLVWLREYVDILEGCRDHEWGSDENTRKDFVRAMNIIKELEEEHIH